MPTSKPTSTWIANPTYEDYQRAALVAFEARQIPQCVEQLAAALSLNPTDERGHALVDQLLAAYPDLLSRLPHGGEAFFGLVALRALVVSEHDVPEALGMLEEVIAFRPTVPYLQWLERWTFEAADKLLIAESVRRLSQSLLGAEQGTAEELNGYHSNLRSLAIAAQRVAAQASWQPMMLQVAVRCLAKLGQEPTAGDPWLNSLTPQHKFELLLGLSRFALTECRYADAGSFALLAFEAGPVLPAAREVTLQLIEAGAFSHAKRVLSRLLAEPSVKEWAEAHLEFVEALTGNADASRRLGVRTQSQDRLALALFKEIGVYRTHLPDPFDVASAFVRRSLKSAASFESDTFDVDVQGQFICPTARLAYQEGLKQLDLKGAIVGDGSMSPNELRAPWTIAASGVVAVVRSPAHAAVAERIRTIAESSFSLHNWALSAASVRQLVEQLVQQSVQHDIEGEVLACFAGVPQQGSLHPVTWLFRVQVVSALVLAGLVTGAKSRSAQMLAELLEASNDWSSAAAALALANLGLTKPEYESWACSSLDAVLARGVLASTAAEHAIVVARSWLEPSGSEPFGRLWHRRMKLVPR